MRLTKPLLSLLAFVAMTVLFSGCGGGSSAGGDSAAQSPTGVLTLGITDAPVDDADAVVVTFSSAEFQGPERITIELDEPVTVNLLEFQGTDQLFLLEATELPAGDYQWLRLFVVEAPELTYIEVAGQQFGLEIPSNAQTGLQLNRGFTIAAGSENQFTIDFDLRKSITQEGTGDYKLRPTLRIVDFLEVGTIEGTVASSLVEDPTCNNGDNNDQGNSVYLFEGPNAPLQDVQGNDNDPLASANVVFSAQASQWEFTLGFVAAGDYTIAFSCDASLDLADNDDSAAVSFSTSAQVTVVAEQTVTVTLEL